MSNNEGKTFFKTQDNGMYFYEDGIKKLTNEEVTEMNKEIYRKENEALPLIKEDGFIPFTVFQETNGEVLEGTFYLPENFTPSNTKGFYEKNKMHFNIYIPSYARANNAPTIDMLIEFNVDNWYVAIDPTQYKDYKKVYGKEHIIIRDPKFRSVEYLDLLSSINTPDHYHGTAGVYNSLLALSRSLGESHYWTMDDDFVGLAMKARKGKETAPSNEKYDKNNYYRCSHIKEEYGFNFKEFMCELEELYMKARNGGFMGLEKFGLVFALPVCTKLGTRNYSYYLSNNKIPFQHIGNHNNDVITSLDLSKRGYVNMLFEGINYNSKPTQAGGGLTELYRKFGTLDKGKVLIKGCPNYAKINYRYSRIHHSVDYTKYNKQRIVGSKKRNLRE